MQLKCPYCKTMFPPQDKCKCPECGKFVNIPPHLRPSFTGRKRKKESREERAERISRRTVDSVFSGKARIAALVLVGMLILGTIQVLTRNAPSSSSPAPKKVSWKPKLARHQMERMYTALEFYKLDCYRYPTREEGLTALTRPLNVFTWKGPYVINMRLTDPWVVDYVYDLDEDGKIILFSCGPDKKPGTADDVISPPPLPLENYDPSLKKDTPEISIVHEEDLTNAAGPLAPLEIVSTNEVSGEFQPEAAEHKKATPEPLPSTE